MFSFKLVIESYTFSFFLAVAFKLLTNILEQNKLSISVSSQTKQRSWYISTPPSPPLCYYLALCYQIYSVKKLKIKSLMQKYLTLVYLIIIFLISCFFFLHLFSLAEFQLIFKSLFLVKILTSWSSKSYHLAITFKWFA